MKKNYIASIASLTSAAVLFSLGLAQAAGGMPLAKFAGNYAGEADATFSTCFNSGFTAVEACSTAPNAVFYRETAVFQSTLDKSGNSCSTLSVTNGPEFPLPTTQSNVLTLIETGTNTSYDPTTETGEASYKVYEAGSGTSCNGSVLVNTANAPVINNSTGSFVVSQKGSRIDSVTLTNQNTPIADVTDFVGHSVAFKQ